MKEKPEAILFPSNFLPVEMDEGFVGREVGRVLLFGADPEVDFHGALLGLSLYDRMAL